MDALVTKPAAYIVYDIDLKGFAVRVRAVQLQGLHRRVVTPLDIEKMATDIAAGKTAKD